MKNETKFTVKASRAEIESLCKNYFLRHGYYELNSKDGFKFTKEPPFKRKYSFSPERLNHYIEVYFKTQNERIEVHEVIRIRRDPIALFSLEHHRFHKTVIDEQYFEDFLNHFKTSIQQRSICKFSFHFLENEMNDYSKIYNFIVVAIVVLIFILSIALKNSISYSLLVFILGFFMYRMAIKLTDLWFLKNRKRSVVNER